MADKLPAMPFYPGDWFKDQSVAMCATATRAVWVDLLLSMWTNDRCGEVTGTIPQLAKLARCSEAELAAALSDLDDTKTADVTKRHEKFTVVNRRMRREYEKRKDAAKRQRKSRGGGVESEPPASSHANVTTPLSVSSSISVSTSVESPPAPQGEPPPSKSRKSKADELAMALPPLAEFPESIRVEKCRMAWQSWLAWKARMKPYKTADGHRKELATAAAKGPDAFLGAIALALRKEWQGPNLRLYLEFLAEGKINADGSENLEVRSGGKRSGNSRSDERFDSATTGGNVRGW